MFDVSKVPRKVLDRWARDRKLQPLYWTLSIILAVCALLTTCFSFAYMDVLSSAEEAAAAPQQVAIGMDLETFKTRVNAYSELRDSNIRLAGESFGYKDGYYSACYLLGSTATVTVHLTDEESFTIHDVEVWAYIGDDDSTTRAAVYIAAFNKALTHSEYIEDVQEMLRTMVEWNMIAGTDDIGDISIRLYCPLDDMDRPLGYVQMLYRRFE